MKFTNALVVKLVNTKDLKYSIEGLQIGVKFPESLRFYGG